MLVSFQDNEVTINTAKIIADNSMQTIIHQFVLEVHFKHFSESQ